LKSDKVNPNIGIDIVIVNYNSSAYLEKCLKSIKTSADDYGVVFHVVDNHSSDDINRVVDLFPDVQFILNKENRGFAAAVNQALGQGNSSYAVLINPDAHIVKDFFRPIINYMNHNPDVGIAGPLVLDSDGSVQGSARAFPNILTALYGRTSLLTRLFPKNRISQANILTQANDEHRPVAVDWLSGACMVVRRKAIEQVGLLDERFFMYWEDADWCKRMWKNDWKVVYFPKVSVTHHVGVSSSHRALRSNFEFHKSVYRLYEKYADPRLFMLKPLLFSALYLRFMGIVFLNNLKKFIRVQKV